MIDKSTIIPIIVFLLSIGLQLLAAVWALFLIRITGRKLAWILISIAMMLMAWRRIISFVSFLTYGKTTIDFTEIIALTISFLMFVGVVRIGVYFRSIRDAEKAMQESGKKLMESEKKYRYLSELTSDYVYSCVRTKDAPYRIDWVGGAFEKITGYTIDELMQLGCWLRLVHPEDSSMVSDYLFKLKPGQSDSCEFRIIAKDGSIRWIHDSNMCIPNEGDTECYRLLGGARDITERKQAIEAMSGSEERFRKLSQEFNALLDSIPDSITLLSPEMKIIWANKIAVERARIPDFIGQYCYKAFYNLDIPCGYCPAKICLDTKKPEIGYVTPPEGKILEVRSIPLINENEKVTAVLHICRDITEHRKLEQQLLQSQKMEAVGVLTGGIAHEFNNILQAIMSIGSLMQMKIKEGDPLRQYVIDLLASTDRAANLTQGLLAFGRKQPVYTIPININETIKRVEKFISTVIGEDIELKVELSDEELTVMADSGQIEQVLMNLLTNARDAMPDGGQLIIQTSSTEIDEEYIMAHGYGNKGRYALISVTDTGEGIDENMKDKIFDPFFTTKEVGKGTGLGLSIAYGIIKQHNGYINVYSELGKGTTFRIYLPLTEAKAEEAVQAKEEEAAKIEGTETILVAEDEGHVRKFTKETLEKFGYEVIVAADGDEAIQKFKENEDRIQLLILDVIMPKRNGREVYDVIRKTSPDIKVIFVSGYPANAIQKKGIFEEGFDFLPKPIPPTKLLETVRRILN